MKNIIKDTIKIMMITLVAGILLGFVYEITKSPIVQAQEDAKQKAYRQVFSQANSFEEDANFTKEKAASFLKENGIEESQIDLLVKALDKDKQVMGYVVNVTNHKGYGGDISFTLGVKADGTINGYEMLSINETAGLGMKATEDKFKSQFQDIKEQQFSVTKNKAASGAEIQAISGATITSSSVTNGVNAGLLYVQSLLTEGGN